MAVRVVTDSTADLPPELAAQFGITVVPLYVLFGTETLRDGIDITTGQFYERLASTKVLPTTSQPAAGDFRTVYERLGQEGADIVSIHISSKLSGTVNSATAARSLVPQCNIEVIDSRSVSFGLGIVAIKAAQAAQEGASLPEVCAVARETAEALAIAVTLDTLEYLRRGGRLGRASALLGSMLSIKPILSVRDGELYPMERVRTRRRALERLYEWAAATENVSDIGVVDSNSAEEADDLRRRLAVRFPDAHVWSGRIGPVLGAHAGPGVVGVLTLRRRARA